VTLFGIDISNFQPGIDLYQVAEEGFSWVEAKVSEGDYYRDPTWAVNKTAAAAAELPILGYHYAAAACAPDSQVQTFLAHGGGGQVMIDFEDNSGTIDDLWALIEAFNAAGVHVAATYLPRWYWAQIGRPDLSQVPGLVSSNYVPGRDFAATLYDAAGGDDGPGWAAYGGGVPQIWQFSDSAQVAGIPVDVNAFQGTHSDLVALLTGQPRGALMALTDEQQNELYTKVGEIWDQLRGPGGQGWVQLGQNAEGQNLTPIDDLAAITLALAALSADVAGIKAALGGKA